MTRVKRTKASWAKARAAVAERADGLCEARWTPGCTGQGAHAHHVRMRSQGGGDELENLLWTCHQCHSRIHASPFEAYSRGLLKRSTVPDTPIPPRVDRERWIQLVDACRRFDEHANRNIPGAT